MVTILIHSKHGDTHLRYTDCVVVEPVGDVGLSADVLVTLLDVVVDVTESVVDVEERCCLRSFSSCSIWRLLDNGMYAD